MFRRNTCFIIITPIIWTNIIIILIFICAIFLQSYSWPGNVRELKFAVERALCVARDDEVDIVDLPHEVRGDGRISLPDSGDFDEQIDGVARGLLMRALEQTQNSQKEAAEQLGLSYDRFRHLLRKHEIIGR